MRLHQANCCQAISRSKNSVLSRDRRIKLQRSLGLIAIRPITRTILIYSVIGIAMQPQQRNRRRRISRRSRRILKRFPPRPQNTKRSFSVGGSNRRDRRIKEPTFIRVEETRHHRIRNRPRKAKITQVRRSLVGIKASNHRESVIIEPARSFPPLRLRIGISNHVL